MVYRHSFTAIFSVLILFSCAAEKEYEPDFNYDAVKGQSTKGQSINADSLFNKVSNTATVVNSPAAVVAQPAAAAGLTNPAHGQPGHRCELAVGAPLTGPAAEAVTTTPMANPVINPTVTQAPVMANQKTTSGSNPAHGQPGHRCDIAVGAPLNSKPLVPATAAKTTSTTTTTPVQKVAAGMNPAHGQPGHRCDIGVGEPLNSKPKAAAATPTSPAPVMAPALVPGFKADSSK